MKDWTARQVRYQQDPSSVQLGGLASNLNRIVWYAQRGTRVEPMLFKESKYFTEWAASSCSVEQQGLLAELQLQLALWERGWGTRLQPQGIAQQASEWSSKLLQVAGLADE
jgi:hypothetical protein